MLYKGELVKAVSGDKIRHEGFKIFSTLDYGNFWKMQEIDPPEEEIPGRNHQYIVGGTKEGKLYVNKKDVMKDPEWQQQLDKIRRFSRNQGL